MLLSAMTTSENFPLAKQSGCSRSPYESSIQPPFIGNLPSKSGQSGKEGESVMSCHLVQGSSHRRDEMMSPPFRCHSSGSRGPTGQEVVVDVADLPSGEVFDDGEERDEKGLFFWKEVPRTKLERDMSDLTLEQSEPDDSSSPFDHSKPLKIDPRVLKLDLSKFSSSQAKRDHSLEKLWVPDFFEMKRTSHHLSGGGLLLTDACGQNFYNSGNDSFEDKLCKFSGLGLKPIEKRVFDLESGVDFDVGPGEMSHFSNQISPSSPLSFDLTVQKQQGNTAGTSGSRSSETENPTNPFKNFSNNARDEENSFPATNPFTDRDSSSLNENPSIILVPPKYENISFSSYRTSFSQCSTRPPSPTPKPPEEPLTSNPFLINDSCSEPCSSPSAAHPHPPPPHFLTTPHPLPSNRPSPLLFAVPVFPMFQHSITDSSTQTVDSSEAAEEPSYQNVSTHLTKFMKRNHHSDYDFQCLKSTMKDLRNSGWYYENVSWQESATLLANTEPGTFLIRDSSDPDFLFSLSVQTCRGPTSVRIHYVNGQFRLDAEKKLIPHMPSFNSVVELVDYYVENTVNNKRHDKLKSLNKTPNHNLHKSKDQVWIDARGNVYSNILLAKPLYKRDHFSTLQHLARLVINKLIRKRLNAKVKFNFRVTPVYESSPFQDSSFQDSFDNFCPILNVDALPLPSKLLQYLKDYPFCH